MKRSAFAILGLMLVGSILAASPAMAATTVSVAPNPIPVSLGGAPMLTVTYAGLPTGVRLFFEQCSKPASDPTFNQPQDCSFRTEQTVNPSDNTGDGTFQFKAFHGAEPSGDTDWGCFAPGESIPEAVTNPLTTCYIRVTDSAEANLTDQQTTAVTFTADGTPPPPVVPESSLPIVLPLLGVAAVGATLIAMRRRRTRVAV